jgi:antitoxin ParD1/3/4
MSPLQIKLPEDAQRLAEEQIAKGRFESMSDYIAALIRRDYQTVEGDAVEEVLKHRLRSGAPTEMTDNDFDTIRTRLESEIIRRRGA